MSRMRFCWAVAASRSCSRLRRSGSPGKARVRSRDRLSVFTGSSFQCRGAWVATPEDGDAIGGGSSRGVGAAAADGGDFGVGQPGEVVVGDGLFLLGGQLGECPGQSGGGVRHGVAGGGGRCRSRSLGGGGCAGG